VSDGDDGYLGCLMESALARKDRRIQLSAISDEDSADLQTGNLRETHDTIPLSGPRIVRG
jgi:hypothetical protein